MRKLFLWNVLIFTLLLLFQLLFQTAFFEPFLVASQQRRLIANIKTMQDALETGDEDDVRQLIHAAVNKGIVLAAVDRDMSLLYGQSFDQFQRCFTIEDVSKKRYTIVEDYLETVPLQTIEVGDKLAIEGYLIDEGDALVIPSKVSRAKDGVVLGTDTFLLVNHTSESGKADTSRNDNSVSNQGITVSTDESIAQSEGTAEVFSKGQAKSVEQGYTQESPEATQTQGVLISDDDIAQPDASDATTAGMKQDESNLPKGFILQSPFETDGGQDGMLMNGALSGTQNNTAILDARMLIVNGDGRNGGSFSISLHGTVMRKEDIGNDDLLIHRGLITQEIKRLSTATQTAPAMSHSYTITKQLTTGKYLLSVSQQTKQQVTVLGVISLYSIKDVNGMLNRFHVLLFVIELLLFSVSVYVFSRMISKPLGEMNGVALQIARQDFSNRVTITSNDELGTLGNSINEISTNLEQKIHQVNEMNIHLQQDYERQVELQNRHKHLSATFSHEMKTPLTIVRGYIDSMQSGIYPQNHNEYYEIALRELDSASTLIAQMLEIARMESPYFTLKKRVIDIWMVFFKVYDELKQAIDRKELSVAYDAEDEANTLADSELLERVISNVLTNAMKYSPQGSRISVKITTAQQRQTFSIENENAFIPTDELEKIWQPFYRVARSGDNQASGTGLGLMIVDEILNAHGFEHAIRNTEHGVEFYFSCPVIVPPIEN